MAKNKFYQKELVIESIAFEGHSIAKDDGVVVFIKGGAPGDKVLVEVLKKKKSYYTGKILEILERGASRVDSECKYFGACGGCSWRHISYEDQLMWKQRHVIDAFERIGKIKTEILPVIACKMTNRYRNKMEFGFSASRWLTDFEVKSSNDIIQRDFALGLHVPGRFDKIIDLDYCLLQSEIGDKLINAARAKALELGASAYNITEHSGFLRHLAIRRSHFTNETMAILITSTPQSDSENAFIEWFKTGLKNEVDGVTTLIHATKDTGNPVADGEIIYCDGEMNITESLLGVKYRVSPFSFFQTNSYQFEILIAKAIEFAGISENDIVWDLYCGAGSITLPTAKIAKKVYGLELSESSISDAKFNQELNGIENVEFTAVDLHTKQSPAILQELPKPDVVIIDPPRAGSHANVITRLLELSPKKIVYVSCNPSTQARDCASLNEKYDVVKVQPVDMFPHTYHIESVALLTLKKRVRLSEL